MREVLFRGKRKDTGEMICSDSIMRLPNNIIELCDEHGKWHIIVPETFAQYTGIPDKNGVKIWEADSVTAYFRNNHSKQKFKVIFEDGMFLFDNGCVKVPRYDIYSIEVNGDSDKPEGNEVNPK